MAGAVAVVIVLAACGRHETTDDRQLGAVMFGRYCASCHGNAGDGTTPLASQLQTAPPDLTRLSKKFGSPLRRDELAAYIDGRQTLAAHGTREMPVWGERLYEGFPETPGTDAVREGTIDLILDHLEAIERQ